MSDAAIGAFSRLVRGDARSAAAKLAVGLSAEHLLALADALHEAAGWESHVVEHDVDDFSGRRTKRITYLGRPAAQEEWVRSAMGTRHLVRVRGDGETQDVRDVMRRIGLSDLVGACGARVVPWDGHPGDMEGPRCQRCAARSA